MDRAIKFIFFIGIILALGSCMQDEDVRDPEIIFYNPEAGYTVYMPDTINVSVEINDDQVIRTVILSLVNENNTPVIESKYYYPNTKEFFIQTTMPLTDKSMASGPYSLLVTASDGNNAKNKFREITIHEIPKEIMAYIAVTGQFDYKSTIVRLNPAFETDTQFVFPEGYLLAGVHSLWEKFFFVTGEPSEIIAIDPATFETAWLIAAAPPRQIITAILTDNELVFSTANGDAGIISGDGTITLRTVSFENKKIQCLAADNRYIYAAHVSLSGDIHELTVFYRVSGEIRTQILVAGEITNLVAERDKVLVFMPSQAGTSILEYDPEEMTPTETTFLPDENVRSVVKINDNQVFLITDDRVITYDIEIGRLTGFISQSFNFGRYDQLNDVIFFARDNTVYGFDRVSADLVDEIFFQEEVFDFQILYNK
jgi:hypothetical protein